MLCPCPHEAYILTRLYQPADAYSSFVGDFLFYLSWGVSLVLEFSYAFEETVVLVLLLFILFLFEVLFVELVWVLLVVSVYARGGFQHHVDEVFFEGSPSDHRLHN